MQVLPMVGPSCYDKDVLELIFLGSGSRGNATLVRWDQTRLLIDCGFTARELNRRLAAFGEHLDRVQAICITHEHSDHVGGLRGLGPREDLQIFGTSSTLPALRLGKRGLAEKVPIQPGRSFRVGQLEVMAFSTSHDALDPVGYRITLPDGRHLGLATDLGIPNDEAVEALAGCELIGIESNHDPDMLEHGPYPWILKQRIRSNKGHLSNPTTAALLPRIAGDRLEQLFAMHLSETNNKPELARQALQEGLDRLGLKAGLRVIDQHQASSYGMGSGQMKLL